MASADPVVKEKIAVKTGLVPPSMFNVIYMNDDVTTMEFVVASLTEVFNHSDESAAVICDAVHTNGSAVAAVLPYELAEQKGVEVTILARNNGFPLLIRLEPVA